MPTTWMLGQPVWQRQFGTPSANDDKAVNTVVLKRGNRLLNHLGVFNSEQGAVPKNRPTLLDNAANVPGAQRRKVGLK